MRTTDPQRAADALLAGGLAVLPTETVYGLGALAVDVHAVARVFAVKGRPADHPLIVHLAGPEQLTAWASDVPGYARRLADACWPGPLTLVLPRGPRAGLHVTGGQDSVGLRVPDHPLALDVLRRVGDGVAAPSANLFGRVSPTTPEHVLAELSGVLVPGRDVVLDGGPCRVGVESTILDCTGHAPRLLRPGAVDAARVRAVTGLDLESGPSRVRAPGTLAAHYAPHAQVRLVDREAIERLASGVEATRQAVDAAPTVGLLAAAEVRTPGGLVRLSAPQSVEEYASVLYAALREADALGLRQVLAVPPGGEGLGAAVTDRLARAAAGG